MTVDGVFRLQLFYVRIVFFVARVFFPRQYLTLGANDRVAENAIIVRDHPGSAGFENRHGARIDKGVARNRDITERAVQMIHQKMRRRGLVGTNRITPAVARFDTEVVIEAAVYKATVRQIAAAPDLKGMLVVPHDIVGKVHIGP